MVFARKKWTLGGGNNSVITEGGKMSVHTNLRRKIPAYWPKKLTEMFRSIGGRNRLTPPIDRKV